jgi:hypothetical protein
MLPSRCCRTAQRRPRSCRTAQRRPRSCRTAQRGPRSCRTVQRKPPLQDVPLIGTSSITCAPRSSPPSSHCKPTLSTLPSHFQTHRCKSPTWSSCSLSSWSYYSPSPRHYSPSPRYYYSLLCYARSVQMAHLTPPPSPQTSCACLRSWLRQSPCRHLGLRCILPYHSRP